MNSLNTKINSYIYSLWPYGSDFSSLLHVLEKMKTSCVTYGSLLAEGVGLPQGLLQGVKSRQQAVTQFQPMTDEKDSSVTDALTKPLSLSLLYIYLVCLAVSFMLLLFAGFRSDCPKRAGGSDWAVCCCWLISVVLVMLSNEEDVLELCSGVDSVLDDVISRVAACLSGGLLAVSFEAGTFAGVTLAGEASGCEARFCETVSSADDRGGFSGGFASARADWLELESGAIAAGLTAVC